MYGQHQVTSHNANANGWKGCQTLCLGCKRSNAKAGIVKERLLAWAVFKITSKTYKIIVSLVLRWLDWIFWG